MQRISTFLSLLFFADVAMRAMQPFVLKGPKSVLSALRTFNSGLVNDGTADEDDLGFSAFADAASLRACSNRFAERQRTSPERPFLGDILARTET